MVPEGWVDGRVTDLLDGLESGVSVNGEDRQFDADEKAVLKVSAVSYGTFDASAAKVIEGSEINRAKTNPRAGQIIISRSNTEELVGASAYIDRDYPNLYLPDKLWQTVPKPGSDMKWLSYVLASKHARYILSNLATGTSGSMKNITKGELLGLKVLIPPANEQKKIAKILSTWDKAIATVEKLITNSQQQKKALMQQLLTGKKRLPGFGGEWKVVKLDALLKEKKRKGMIVPTNEDAKGIPYIGSTSFEGNFAIYTESGDAVFCEENDILILWDGENAGKSATGLRGAVSSTVVRLRLNLNKADSVFVNNCLIRDNYKIREIREGSGIPHMPGDFEHWYEIGIPSVEEQKAISDVLTSVDRNVSALIKQLEYLKQEKKALMQQLLTGKRRVNVGAAA